MSSTHPCPALILSSRSAPCQCQVQAPTSHTQHHSAAMHVHLHASHPHTCPSNMFVACTPTQTCDTYPVQHCAHIQVQAPMSHIQHPQCCHTCPSACMPIPYTSVACTPICMHVRPLALAPTSAPMHVQHCTCTSSTHTC